MSNIFYSYDYADIMPNLCNPATGGLSAVELLELQNLEVANTFVKNLDDLAQALLYKALYLNDMRIDKAEGIIRRNKAK